MRIGIFRGGLILWELGSAGIDPDEFDLMNNDEKIEALQEAGLDPDDFE